MGSANFLRLVSYTAENTVERQGGSSFTVSWEGDPLEVGDAVRTGVTSGKIYLGLTDNGELVLQIVATGQIQLATNSSYSVGDPLPSYSAVSYPPCFLPGTTIAVPGGECRVEDLRAGSLVTTVEGRPQVIRWIGRKSQSSALLPEAVRPIRLSAGALGDGLPVRDLRVTADHALLIDGLLVQAGALVNGRTIVRMTAEELGDTFTVHHIELDDHALVLAEGVPAETFVDNVTRRRFDNYDEYEDLYGNVAPLIREMALPRVKSARQLPAALRRRLEAAAGETAPPATDAA
ncbi:Hint domain-containing protein [Pseudoxanthobacter sp. M-2]|uniref:Hint domain-containing protein n=1 Tax=Pseudoxanthobacter sp. M-2 TaxID=3078754 RepID=UPI0038FCE6C7